MAKDTKKEIAADKKKGIKQTPNEKMEKAAPPFLKGKLGKKGK